MDLDPVLIARLQFAFTIIFHIIFPAFTIGLSAYSRTCGGNSMNGTVSVRVLKPSRLFVQLGNNSRKNRQAASLNDD
jgi:hypothetical protein